MKTITCIIQARRQSSRLPDKILMPLRAKPVLQHVVERCMAITSVTSVVVAAPEGNFEDPIEDLAHRIGALCFRGSMTDVLERFHYAAQLAKSDYVMRVTADCPLLDPALCGMLAEQVVEAGADYGTLVDWPHGLDCEIFTTKLLADAHQAADLAVDREHVTLWMKKQKSIIRHNIHAPRADLRPGNRWVIDYPDDYRFLQALFNKLPAQTTYPTWQEIIAILDADSGLRLLNADCEQDWNLNNQSIQKQSEG